MDEPLQEDVDFLAHYGKKGMKWGVRKSNRSKARAKAERNRPINKVKKLSDEDLKKAISRMELEKKYVELSRSTNSSAGKKYAGDLLKVSGKTAVGTLVGGVAGKAVKAAIKP